MRRWLIAIVIVVLAVAAIQYWRWRRHPGYWIVQVGTNIARNSAPVPLTSEPSHHLVLSNDYVRVFRVEAAPKATTLIHQHDRDYIWTSLGPSDLINSVTGKPPAVAHVEDGEVRFVPGGFSHSVTNTADRPFRNITIELLKPGSQKLAEGDDEHGVTLFEGGQIEQWLVRDGVRARVMEIGPGKTFSRERPPLHLVVIVAGSCTPDPSDAQGEGLIGPRGAMICNVSGLSQAGENQGQWFFQADSESFATHGAGPVRLLILDF
jgi:quercetin dioxygenase-like cupin family protein